MAQSFARDIRPLFRDKDIDCMRDFGNFDLSLLSDVRANSANIYARLQAGDMPEDGPWPDEQIARFKQWMDEGMAE